MSIMQIIATIASIVSIPLAVHYAHKTANATSDKARLEIIKTLSYKLSIERALTYDDIFSVYNSKLREHKIDNPKFGIEDIIHDLKADIMSNAFIENNIRSEMLLNLTNITMPDDYCTTYSNFIFTRLVNFLMDAVNPIFVLFLIIVVIQFFAYLPNFITIVYGTIYYFDSPSSSSFDVFGVWRSYYHHTGLYISIPCLAAWTVLVITTYFYKSTKKKCITSVHR